MLSPGSREAPWGGGGGRTTRDAILGSCILLFFFRYKNFLPFESRLVVRSSLVTRGSALPDACQLRPDIALTRIRATQPPYLAHPGLPVGDVL